MVPIERVEFDTLDDAALIWTCIEPTIRKIRGKDLSVKAEAAAGLTAGQRSLLMFQIMRGHAAGGSAMLFGSLSYLLSHKGMWDRLRDGMRYFQAAEMLRVLDALEAAYPAFASGGAVGAGEEELDRLLSLALPPSVKRVAAYIRENPGEFVRFI